MRKHSSVVLQKLLIFDVWKSQSSVRTTSCLWFLPFLQTVMSLLTCIMNKTLMFRWSFRPIAAAESSGSPETQQNYKATACSCFMSLSVWVYCSFFFLFVSQSVPKTIIEVFNIPVVPVEIHGYFWDDTCSLWSLWFRKPAEFVLVLMKIYLPPLVFW